MDLTVNSDLGEQDTSIRRLRRQRADANPGYRYRPNTPNTPDTNKLWRLR